MRKLNANLFQTFVVLHLQSNILVHNTVYLVFYRPLSGEIRQFFEYVDSYLSFTSAEQYDVILSTLIQT